ncbi:MAG TPA: hypothetical protein VK001_04490, partial [Geminicoccaceae bacterium]|nr:hypothetical protein [Geminicoccaceae bacterium]
MAKRSVFTDRQLQDYIDGRLSERDRASVAAYLLAHPDVAAEVETVRRQSEALRALGQEILDEPVPERLREVLRLPLARPRAEPDADKLRAAPPRAEPAPEEPPVAPPRRRRAPNFLEAAAAILLLCAGVGLGWLAHGIAQPAPSPEDRLLAQMAYAYGLYGARDYPVAFPPERADDFVGWIGRSFQREVRPPDLADFGYRYRGGRVIPTAGTRIGLFQFEHPENAGLAVFFWTADTRPEIIRALDAHEDIAARFWNADGLNFAVVSDRTNQ